MLKKLDDSILSSVNGGIILSIKGMALFNSEVEYLRKEKKCRVLQNSETLIWDENNKKLNHLEVITKLKDMLNWPGVIIASYYKSALENLKKSIIDLGVIEEKISIWRNGSYDD